MRSEERDYRTGQYEIELGWFDEAVDSFEPLETLLLCHSVADLAVFSLSFHVETTDPLLQGLVSSFLPLIANFFSPARSSHFL